MPYLEHMKRVPDEPRRVERAADLIDKANCNSNNPADGNEHNFEQTPNSAGPVNVRDGCSYYVGQCVI